MAQSYAALVPVVAAAVGKRQELLTAKNAYVGSKDEIARWSANLHWNVVS
jgi:hypothetical protein